ncbi:MAG: hypothetical protein WD995_05145 [Gemmatimonadota bacterium]
MRTHNFHSILTTILAVVGLGLFHIARPVAVSAQSAATMRVEVTVLPADAAWAAHRMTELVARTDIAAAAARQEELGTVVWRETEPVNATLRVVTVAHLAN